jgi:hypothetical protein
MKIITKELTPSLWTDLETLFGNNGACGGCWCIVKTKSNGPRLRVATQKVDLKN